MRSLALGFTLALACRPDPDAPTRAGRAPTPHDGAAIALHWRSDSATLELPASTRPADAPITDDFHPFGEAKAERAARADAAARVWSFPLPVHPSLFPTQQAGGRTFGFYAPHDVEVLLDGQPLTFARNGVGERVWGYDHTRLFLGLPADQPPPTADRVTIRWPRAAALERSLHLATSGRSPAAFAFRDLVIDLDGHHGILLPAPAKATWTLTLPERAVLDLRATIVRPSVTMAPSDGAMVRVEVTPQGGAPTVAGSVSAQVDRFTDGRVDLARFAGQTVTVSLISDPGASPTADLVFLTETVIHTPKPAPRRVVLAFLDTVRRDHVGAYGYARPTTPRLDAWADRALRVDDARTVAPWTLPSARAALSGAEPERWFETPSLAARLSAAGFLTDGAVANAFLAPTFQMHRGFDRYRFRHLQPAKRTVDDAIAAFEQHPDRDVAVYVQLMEAHLPYNEPEAYRHLFAGDDPPGLRDLSRSGLDGVRPGAEGFDAARAWLIDRYDQNLRVMDDALARLIEAAGPDAVVVVFADHGEEFWDHGGFEHGHAFGEELLRVPLIVSSPDLRDGALSAPASLLDLTPTVLDLLGLPASAPAGRPLRGAAEGEPDALAWYGERVRTFGRPLYGEDGWGWVRGAEKWWTRGRDDHSADLGWDPRGDRPHDVADPARAQVLSDALGVPVHRVWRVSLSPARDGAGDTLTVTHPAGFARAWKGYDPRNTAEGVEPVVDGATVTLTALPGRQLPAALYLLPADGDVTHSAGLQATLASGKGPVHLGPAEGAAHRGGLLLGPTEGKERLTVDVAWAVEPFGRAVEGASAELEGLLKELGYVQ
jgi:hypothetical protein